MDWLGAFINFTFLLCVYNLLLVNALAFAEARSEGRRETFALTGLPRETYFTAVFGGAVLTFVYLTF